MKPVSDKRKKKLAANGDRLLWNSTFKIKPYNMKRIKLRETSPKAAELWNKCRQRVFKLWGKKCFLCGRGPSQTILDCHHISGRTGDAAASKYDERVIVPLCSWCTGCRAHDHAGKDDKFYVLKERIVKEMLKREEV